MTQDLPTNLFWEELYNAVPNSKVILTIRDSDEQWYKSWISFNEYMINHHHGLAIPLELLNYLMEYGWMGNALKRLAHNCKSKLLTRVIDI